MAKDRSILPAYIQDYLCSVSANEDDILQEVREKTASHPCAKMQITPDQGQFLKFMIKLLCPENILEIGVFTGYSSIVMGLSMPENGKIIALDKNPEWTSRAKKFWEKAGLTDKIDLRLGDAALMVDDLFKEGYENKFDFIFIDADKQNYPLYFDKCLKLLSDKGVMIMDNTLWGGKVANPEFSDQTTDILKSFNKTVSEDQRVDISMVPISDGMTLIKKV